MEVRELQHRPPATCALTTPVADVARIMRKDNVGSVVVLDDHDRITGIVTDRDIVMQVVADDLDASTPVRHVMAHNVDYVYENADVFAAAEEMAGMGVRRLPVLDAQGHLTGVVSFDDLLIVLSDQIARLGRAVRAEMSASQIP